MRRLPVLSLTAVLAMASFGCQSATNTNVANATKANTTTNSNQAIVVPSNSNAAANTDTTTGNSNRWNANMSRADYDRDRAKYEAEKGTSTIGTGANDSWIWFKTKAALAGVNDLRDSTINVDVANDVITLRGSVGSQAQKTAAENAAKGIEGQKGVKNQLTVNANDSMTNQMTSGNATTSNSNANMKK
jgi:hyperosmotically inducible protein